MSCSPSGRASLEKPPHKTSAHYALLHMLGRVEIGLADGQRDDVVALRARMVAAVLGESLMRVRRSE